MTWTCPHCGCTRSHFNSSRLCEVCSGCGAPVLSPEQRRQQLQDQEALARASAYYRAGSWDAAFPLLRGLTDRNPADAGVHALLVRTVTHDLTCSYIGDKDQLKAARASWAVLARQNRLDAAMLQFAKGVFQFRQDYERRGRLKGLLCILAAFGCAIASVVMTALGFWLPAVIPIFACYKAASCGYLQLMLHPFFRRSIPYSRDYNPF